MATPTHKPADQKLEFKAATLTAPATPPAINAEANQKHNLNLLLSSFSIGAKIESLIYSLGTGLLATAIVIFAFSHLPPVALLIISSLYLSGFVSWVLWRKFGENATTTQRALLLFSAVMIGALFALCMSFAAIPSIGLSATLAGGGLLIAAANISLYLIIALAIAQLGLSTISAWYVSQPIATASSVKGARSIAQSFNLTRRLESNPAYSFNEKSYLCYGFIISSALGLTMGALSFYGIAHFLPQALLAFGLSVSTSSLMPLAITLLIVSTLVIGKVIMSKFIANAQDERSERLKTPVTNPPSLLQELLNESQGTYFLLEPFKKTRQVLKALWKAHYSYQAYTAYRIQHCPDRLRLTESEFRARSIIGSIFLLIFGVPALLTQALFTPEYQKEMQTQLNKELFWHDPLSYSRKFISATYNYLFSYNYYKSTHSDFTLTAQQFYLRNILVLVITPLSLGLLVFSLYVNTLGVTQFMLVFNLSAAATLSTTSLLSSLSACLLPLTLFTIFSISNTTQSKLSNDAPPTQPAADQGLIAQGLAATPTALRPAPHGYQFTPAQVPFSEMSSSHSTGTRP